MAQTTRLYLDQSLTAGHDIRLDGDEAQYLGRVLRLRPGDHINVFNGRDGEYAAELRGFSRKHVEIRVHDRLADPDDARTESQLRLHLVQGLARGERMDVIVQKTTELGVKRITPVLTQYCTVGLDAARAAKRREHWQRIAINAAEQCGRLKPPLIDPVSDLNDWLGNNLNRANVTELMLDPRAESAFLGSAPPAAKLCLLVGPEGGLADSEIDDARLAGFSGVTLGPRILRTETAAIAAVTLAQAAYGDLGGRGQDAGDTTPVRTR